VNCTIFCPNCRPGIYALFAFLSIWIAVYSFLYEGAPFVTLAANPYLPISTFLPQCTHGYADHLDWRGACLARICITEITVQIQHPDLQPDRRPVLDIVLPATLLYADRLIAGEYILHWIHSFHPVPLLYNEVQFWISTSLTLLLIPFVVKMAGAKNLSRNHVRIQEEP
jgi:hypothetical protein